MSGPQERYLEEEEYEGLGMGDYAGSIGSTALSGALAGSSFGPVGTAIGAVGGGIAGGLDAAFTNRQQREAYEQQLALNRELEAAGADIEAFTQDSAIAAGRQADQAADSSAFAARRAGLNPFQQEQLSNAIRSEAQSRALESQGQRVQAAQAATRAAREGILGEYLTAQKLQNDATQGSSVADAFAASAQAAATLGELRSQAPGAAVDPVDAPGTAEDLGTGFGVDQNASAAAPMGAAFAPDGGQLGGSNPIAGAPGALQELRAPMADALSAPAAVEADGANTGASAVLPTSSGSIGYDTDMTVNASDDALFEASTTMRFLEDAAAEKYIRLRSAIDRNEADELLDFLGGE